MTALDKTPLAFSYIRFSSGEQAKGDSLRRQTEAAADWCQRNKVRLDETITLRDLGKSAYLGKHKSNPDRYALAAFLKMVENGKVPQGSFLIIENLDRLSREHERAALRLWLDILDGGVNIVTVKPEYVYRHEKSDMFDCMRAIMELSRGHNESAVKSERVGGAWQQKKKAARAGKKQPKLPHGKLEGHSYLTAMLPGWIEARGGTLVKKPTAAAAVARVFALTVGGYGQRAMVRQLEKEGIASFGTSGHWTPAYIHRIVSDRRAMGEHQPRNWRTGKPDGPPVAGYFPAVVSEQEWLAARAAIRKRRHRQGTRQPLSPQTRDQIVQLLQQGNTINAIATILSVPHKKVYRVREQIAKANGQQRPAKTRTFINLFTQLVKHARDGESYIVTECNNDSGPARRVLVNITGTQARAARYAFPLPVFEQAIFSCLREIDPREIINGDAGPDETRTLAAEAERLDQSIQLIVADMEQHGESPTLFKRLREQEAKKREVEEKRKEARLKAAHPLSESWGECQTLVDALEHAPDKDDARLRLRSALRQIVNCIYLLVVRRGKDRVAAVQIHFAGGKKHRDYLIYHRPARGNGKARIEAKMAVRAFADVLAPDDRDLRDRKDAADLEQILTGLSLDKLQR
jgi:DNA invertase Pin-like site-specific DNA recombinase